jgi:hypothetical protein
MSKPPFQLPQNAQTISKYSGLWEHFLCYSMRTAPMDADEEETEMGVYFSRRQRIVINNIREMLKVGCLDDEYTDETEKDEGLGEVLMHFCWMVLNHNMERETVYRPPLMHFLAVMGIDAGAERLRHSFVYTPYLAGVLWVSRLLILEYALRGILLADVIYPWAAGVWESAEPHLHGTVEHPLVRGLSDALLQGPPNRNPEARDIQ